MFNVLETKIIAEEQPIVDMSASGVGIVVCKKQDRPRVIIDFNAKNLLADEERYQRDLKWLIETIDIYIKSFKR